MRSLTKNEAIAVSVGIVVVMLVFGAHFIFDRPSASIKNLSDLSFNTNDKPIETQSTQSTNTTKTMPPQTSNTAQPSQFKITDTVIGTGPTAKAGQTILVNYTGKFVDGTPFDSSVLPQFQHVQPFSFQLGAGRVIKGWDMGFEGMKVGGKRTLVIPAELAYGAQGQGSIPGGATLIFDIELLGVK